ncbi:MAG: hypothetical protein HOM61_05665 [Candidatus Marinimicrobia bacterium]|nr:hypothetical protein [Candidatus Neomarinimicrobiota bacterium]
MPYFLVIIFITFSFSSIHPIHEKIQFSIDEKVNSNFGYSPENDGDSQSSNINMKAMLYSAILPGSGEYSMGYTNRGYLFLGIEAIAVGTWYIFNQKGLDTQDKYRAYADEHWSLDRWFYDYSKWKGTPADSIFINFDDEYYPDIWDDSHHLNFSVNGNYFSSNSVEFEDFYDDYALSDSLMAVNFFNDNNIQVEKDHHYYENIGKYDHFYAGWEDNDSLYVVVKELGGEYIAMSPHKKGYRETWNDSNDNYRVASFALSALVANHFASIMDVLILSKLSNNKITNLTAKTYFSPINPYGVGGIKLSFNWN